MTPLDKPGLHERMSRGSSPTRPPRRGPGFPNPFRVPQERRHLRPKGEGKVLSVGGLPFKRGEGKPGPHASLGHKSNQVRKKRHFTPVAHIPRDIPVTRLERIANGGNRHPPAHGALEERGSEGQHGPAPRARPLRKQDNPPASLKSLLDRTGRASRAGGTSALREDAAHPPRKPAEGRPPADLALRDEERRARRSKDNDVEVPEVVADDEPLRRDLARHVETYVEDPHELPGHTVHRVARVGRLKRYPERSARQRAREPERTPEGTKQSHGKNLRLAAGCRVSTSRNVRKSIVPNWLSRAGSPQILAPRPRYA